MASVDFPYQPIDTETFVAPTTSGEYIYSSLKKSWIFSSAQVSGGRIIVSGTPPPQPLINDIWINKNDYSLYVFDNETFDAISEGRWVGLTNMGLTASVYVGEDPPMYTQQGALWYNNVTGDLKVRYNYRHTDQTSLVNEEHSVWVAITGNGVTGLVTGQSLDVMQILDAMSTRVAAIEDGQAFKLEL